jgi:hypothetical protein
MTKPIPDKAEVALEYPDKLYIGTFERTSRFDSHLDPNGISLTLERTGDADVRKSVHMHFHYGLFADILQDLAKTASSMPADDELHRDALRAAAEALVRSLSRKGAKPKSTDHKGSRAAASDDKGDVSKLTPHDEVLLLHVLE